MKQRMAWAVVLVVMAASLGGFAAESKSAVGKHIGVSVMNNVEPAFRLMVEAGQVAAKDRGVILNVVSADGDIARQINQVEDFISNKMDAIMVMPCDGEGIVPAVEAANAAGVPIITVDIGSAGGDVAAHVSADNYGGGFATGEWLVKRLGGKGHVIIMNDTKIDSVYPRADGFKAAIKDSGIEIAEDANVGYQRDIAMKSIEDFLIAYPEVNAIFAAQGMDVAIAANDAVIAANKLGKVVVCGFDGFEESLDIMRTRESALETDCFFDADAIGYKAVETVADILEGKPIEKRVVAPAPLITLENVDAFYAEKYGK